TNKGEKQTIHYFSNHRLDTFVRSVHAVLCITSNQQRKDKNLIQPYIIKSERAIVLNRPTPIFNYQYIWITSPMIPEYSLYHIMMKPSNSSFVDTHQIGYKVWSINALLKSIDTVHSHGFAHLAIDLTSFYINHEMKTTDWRLGNFDFARLLTDKYVYSRGGIKFPPHTSYTAPEIIQEKQITLDQLKKVDIWSLGCVIYTLVTEGLILFEDATHIKNLMTFNDDMKNYLKIVIRDHVENLLFKNLLELMLQVYPDNRKTIKEIISYW
ncbi:kinase-like domain-containing protein, partial [Cokeromyces recurvatus]|uniref:kinase-like domain-containing protein n=1 Tax=Cokeromyces recurvatus TaxID=90255 RepID=UPI00221EB182